MEWTEKMIYIYIYVYQVREVTTCDHSSNNNLRLPPTTNEKQKIKKNRKKDALTKIPLT